MRIEANKSVSAKYDLYVDGENQGELELMERATEERPLSFIYGVGMMLPKFEENLYGLQSGDSFEFTINDEDAYGPYDEEAVIDLDKKIFEVDGKIDENVVFEGNVVPLMDTDGNRFNAQIVTVTDQIVTVDLNHPLAGQNLHFKGQVLEVREASEAELAALMNNSCSCGGNCSSDEGCSCDSDGCEDPNCTCNK
ncbi:FKBP-type peptidyl-prolyl cis-trans isomerase [Porphyromonadaceae sp. NP-X]|nr:FKBP-type peptidyl-prolyl cis-trans isomerase [Porphyromonadaceae sp. NP-X]NLJ20970.1 peptidylprolyl isomerase [Bacteroidales bacterium]